MARIDAKLAERLIGELNQDLTDDGRLGLVRRYLRGDQDLPYIPRGAVEEFTRIAQGSITNWLSLVSDTYAKGLWVDGYRAPKVGDNAKAWEYWQANGLDARQGIVHRGAVDHGTSYNLVLPSKGPAPVIKPMSPLRSTAWYDDEDAEFPEIGLHRKGRTARGDRLYDFYDARSVYRFAQPETGPLQLLGSPEDHGLGVTPFVRFRDRLDCESVGMIRPLIRTQNRINDIVFSTMIALQYASFRQRWATGLAVPHDDDGNPVEPFEAAVSRLWVSDDQETKFGDFAQTDVSGHLNMYDSAVKTLAGHAQISPNILTGDLLNLSADALAQMEQSTQRKMGELETLFGESWESTFRLASLAAGDRAGSLDVTAQVRWRDTEARSLAATVDALGKLATMLSVPAEALWEKIPGVTDTDVRYWKQLREQNDVLGSIFGEIGRQSSSSGPADPASAEQLPAA